MRRSAKIVIQLTSGADGVCNQHRIAAKAQKVHGGLQDAHMRFDTAKDPLIALSQR